jgi:uncharacterized delta-60 repeat protein
MHLDGDVMNDAYAARSTRQMAFAAAILLLANSVVGFAADSDLDLAFGTGGIVKTDFFGGDDYAFAVALQADSKIVVTGAHTLVRYQPNGSLDTSFGTGGRVTLGIYSNALAVQPDGKIVVAGGGPDFAVARYNSDGSLDSSFAGGVVHTDFFGQDDRADAIAIQADGSILVAGRAATGPILGRLEDFALARYKSDGTLDSLFGISGKVSADFSGGNDNARALTVQSDGKILVTGHTLGATNDFAMARYNSDGTFDTFFGSGGQVVTDFFSSRELAYAAAIQNDGKIVVAGEIVLGSYDFALARFNSDGSLDSSFGAGGKVTTDFAGGDDSGVGIGIQADGKIVVSGPVGVFDFGDFGVARYNANGTLDSSFGGGGTVATNIYGDEVAFGMVLQADGKIVVAGFGINSNGNADILLTRYGSSATNAAPTLSSNSQTVTVEEGQTAINAGTYSDADAGDSVAITASIGSGSKTGTSSGSWTWSLPVSDGPAQTQSVTITADDGKGGVTSTQFSLVVNNVAPVIAGISGPTEPVALGTPTILSANFTDVGVLDTHTCTFSWDDGTSTPPSTPAVTVSETGGSGSCNATHVYAAAGVYTVEVTVTDKDGALAKSHFRFVVVYDPSAGFVTGGGRIDSPAGAYVAYPALTGNATFGFVAKYQQGASAPSGNTEFQFHVANLNFSSHTYEWLVVAGYRAQYKGVGTINGSGSYSFLLTAADGQKPGGDGVDRLRLKIWNSLGLIYDNVGGSDDIDAVEGQAITNGSIVIHKN